MTNCHVLFLYSNSISLFITCFYYSKSDDFIAYLYIFESLLPATFVFAILMKS